MTERNPEWAPLYEAACDIITEVMTAGIKQREAEGKPTDEWMRLDPADRLHHAFMHLVSVKTHEGKHGDIGALTENTALEEWKHALCGLAIVGAHEGGYIKVEEAIEE